MAGLQDMAPTVENRWVTSAVRAPIRAAAAAASQPACPPPITMTSKRKSIWQVSRIARVLSMNQPAGKLKTASTVFHVKHGGHHRSFTDAEIPEDHVED